MTDLQFDNALCLEHLKGMVQIPTRSSADPEKMDLPAFYALHDYLKKTYPLSAEALSWEVVGRASLLCRWKGDGSSGKLPLLLAAHEDVVPEGDPAQWLHPPYAGEVAEGCLWGRGTTDSKMNIMAYLEAVEALLVAGYVPGFDLYLAFGQNEEIMGGPEPGAGQIAAVLKTRGVRLGCVIDECGGVSEGSAEGMEGIIAQLIVAEKGYADFEFSKTDVGGHSSQPGAHSALGVIGQVAVILEDHPSPCKLTPFVAAQFRASAPRIPGRLGELLAEPEKNWEELLPLLQADPKYHAMIHTTTAVTMAKGSEQANILPERATLVAQCRLLPGETVEELQTYFEGLMPAGVEVRLLKGHNPPPVASVDTPGYRLLSDIIREWYPEALVIPTFLLGGTDSRWYFDLCESGSVYRCGGFFHTEAFGPAHRVNEKIPCDNLTHGPRFFSEYIQRYGDCR